MSPLKTGTRSESSATLSVVSCGRGSIGDRKLGALCSTRVYDAGTAHSDGAGLAPATVGRMPRSLAWIAEHSARMEVAHVELTSLDFVASGTQLGVTYELRYRIDPRGLHLELVGERMVDLDLDGADFFDLGWSPLFNSLPVIRDGLLTAGPPRDYRMRWVEVPSLQVSLSEQRYEPLGNGAVRFRAGDFVSDITFDPQGFVVKYPGIGTRA